MNSSVLYNKAKKKHFWNGSIIAFIMLFTFACGPFDEYTQNIAVNNASWPIDKSLRFEYLSQDTLAEKDFFINLRHTGLYKYNNIYFFITILAPNGENIKDTVEFTLANPEGKWAGKGIGDLYDVRLAYKHNIRFGQLGKYTFIIQHGMRDLKLEEITDVGISIKDINK